MNSAVAVMLLLAVLSANAPFFSERLFGFIGLKQASKAFAWRLLELIVVYFFVGGVSLLLERKVMPIHHQDWEFYAVTACVFIVMAAPGFVYRYLWKSN